jgi:hypothetical protein
MSSWSNSWHGLARNLADLFVGDRTASRRRPDTPTADAAALSPEPLVRPPAGDDVSPRALEERERELRILMAHWM